MPIISLLLLIQILSVVPSLSSSLEQQNQRENQLRRRRKPSTSKHRSYQEIFPGVYTLKLPIFELQNSQEMISDMDLLHIECNRIPLTKADSNNNTDCTMHTLIHSHQELEYLKNVLAHGALSQHQPDLLFDFNSTQALLQTSSKNNSERRTETEHASTNQYPTILGFDCFANMQGMHAWLREFASTAPPHLDVSLTDIGDSYNKTQDSNYGYDIYALKITAAAVSSISKKSPLMILTGVHPREYSPPETVRQWIQQFLDPDNTYLQTILQTTEIHWVPYVNPDGRHYAETKQPYRRKNLNRNAPGSEFCNADEYGVDINRNFPFRWGLSSGSSIRACSQTYRGASAGSEPETQAVMNYALSVFPGEQRKAYDDFHLNNPVAYNEETARGVFIDIHAYGNYYIWPWGFVNNPTPNHESLTAMVGKLSYRTGYSMRGPGPSYTDPASGATDDWAYGTLGAAGMTWEIGTTFQQDCNVFDSAVVDKNIRALNYAASLTHQPYILSKGPDIVYLNVSPTQWNLSQGQVMDIRVRASDEEMIANGNFATAKQDVVEIQLFFDKHPYEASFPDWILDKSQVSKKGEGELQLEWDAVSQLLAGDLFAKHVIYVQAVDSDGDVGPILSVSFAVFGLPTESPSTSAVPSSHPTSSLSESPTDEPPTALPTSPSPATRTSLPTKEPTSPTSPTAPSDCKDTDSEICDFILARGDTETGPLNYPSSSSALLFATITATTIIMITQALL